MDYFCYLSQAKIDHLLESNDIPDPKGTSEKHTASTTLTGTVQARILPILNGQITYGRSDMLVKNEALKRRYVERLKTLLGRMAPSIGFFDWTRSPTSRKELLFFHEDSFVVQNVDEVHLVATIKAEHEGRVLFLDCSMRYFSDEPVRNGRVSITSTNYSFFQRKLPLRFETIFLLTGIDGPRYFGSPLYLKLGSIVDLVL